MASEPSAKRDNPPDNPGSPEKSGEFPSGSPSGSQGFINRLAQRSTGLEPPLPTRSDDEKSPWSIAGMGFQLVATTLLFAGMGYLLDREFGWSPWGLVVMTLIGMIGGLYLLIKEALKLTK